MSIFNKPGTKRYFIAQRCESGVSRSQTYAELKGLVMTQKRPWIFSANVNGRRIPKPLPEQYIELKNEINRVYNLLGRLPEDGDNIPVEKPVPQDDDDDFEDDSPDENEVDSEPEQDSDAWSEDKEIKVFMSEWRRLRRWIADRAVSSNTKPVDSLDSMRPVQGGIAAIRQGIPAVAMLHAMTLHWAPETRAAAGVEPFDPHTISEDLGRGFHKLVGYILKLAKAGVPVMLIGPSGTGKSHIARQVSEILGVKYGQAAMTAGATRGDFLGRHTLSGFQPAEFPECYGSPSVFCFDEIDAAEPNMLILLNDALSGRYLHNSTDGTVIERHDEFMPFATANTFGLGPNAQYAGREKLDFATIDRWRMGRVYVELDEDLADAIAGLNGN